MSTTRTANFGNGYSARITRHPAHTELAVLRNGKVDTSTPITGDVLIFLPGEDLGETLQAISELPNPNPETRSEEPNVQETQKPDFPAWIEELSPSDIAAINQGGCESGAYMPAVTYSTAVETMSQHGDEVMEYLNWNDYFEAPTPPSDASWSQRCCFFLSVAVELWCQSHEHLEDWDKEDWD